MDATLAQLLTEMYQQRLALDEREQRIALLEAENARLAAMAAEKGKDG